MLPKNAARKTIKLSDLPQYTLKQERQTQFSFMSLQSSHTPVSTATSDNCNLTPKKLEWWYHLCEWLGHLRKQRPTDEDSLSSATPCSSAPSCDGLLVLLAVHQTAVHTGAHVLTRYPWTLTSAAFPLTLTARQGATIPVLAAADEEDVADGAAVVVEDKATAAGVTQGSLEVVEAVVGDSVIMEEGVAVVVRVSRVGEVPVADQTAGDQHLPPSRNLSSQRLQNHRLRGRSTKMPSRNTRPKRLHPKDLSRLCFNHLLHTNGQMSRSFTFLLPALTS